MRIVGYGNHENVEVEIAFGMATVILKIFRITLMMKISEILILKFLLREEILILEIFSLYFKNLYLN